MTISVLESYLSSYKLGKSETKKQIREWITTNGNGMVIGEDITGYVNSGDLLKFIKTL